MEFGRNVAVLTLSDSYPSTEPGFTPADVPVGSYLSPSQRHEPINQEVLRKITRKCRCHKHP